MSKFNTKSSTKTVNLAGGEAFTETPKLEFISILLTSFVKDQFYRGEDESVERIKELTKQIDPVFCAKASLYARNTYGMRSVSHIVAGEIAKNIKGQTWTRKYFKQIVHRPDDATEILAYYIANYGKPIPNALKDGLGLAVQGFNEYTLAKYRGDGKAVSMVDLVNLCRPKGTEAINKLMKGELKSFDTWETELSKTGEAETEEEKDELKKQAWSKLIKEKKLGYFALLRNLRNIIEQNPEIVDEACEMLINEESIKKSLVLPFRYSTAVREIEQLNGKEVRKVLVALSKAVDISVQNVPVFEGNSLVVLDSSGSMEGQPAEIGSLFSAVFMKTNNCDFMLFSNDAQYQTYNPQDSVLTIADRIPFINGGTNFHAIFEEANTGYDRIIILSDMQGWIGSDLGSSFAEYKRRTDSNPVVYSWDLQGYGTLQFPERNVYCLAGFSEKVFDVMKMLETDRNALISTIEKIEL